jgi:hypothetical protein
MGCTLLPLQYILRGFYTSAVLNFITWNAAYAIFPRSTFLKHETFPLQPLNHHFGALHSKYSKRGWRTVIPTTVYDRFTNSPSVRVVEVKLDDLPANKSTGPQRCEVQLGGKQIWRLHLDTISVSPPSEPDSVIEQSSFSITSDSDDNEGDGGWPDWESFDVSACYTIYASIFTSHVLRHKYIFGNRLLWSIVGRIFERATLGQLYKLKPEERNALLTHPVPYQRMPYTFEFDKPETWDYYDDQLPALLNQD